MVLAGIAAVGPLVPSAPCPVCRPVSGQGVPLPDIFVWELWVALQSVEVDWELLWITPAHQDG